MPVGITLYHERVSSAHQPPLHTVWAKDMRSALANAARYCKYHELAGGGPDATVYAYDCLGGLRFEARRRGNDFSIKLT
jgi:hypothetical protein